MEYVVSLPTYNVCRIAVKKIVCAHKKGNVCCYSMQITGDERKRLMKFIVFIVLPQIYQCKEVVNLLVYLLYVNFVCVLCWGYVRVTVYL